jgi:hypothetical protein
MWWWHRGQVRDGSGVPDPTLLAGLSLDMNFMSPDMGEVGLAVDAEDPLG